jgi:hypothetical protein
VQPALLRGVPRRVLVLALALVPVPVLKRARVPAKALWPEYSAAQPVPRAAPGLVRQPPDAARRRRRKRWPSVGESGVSWARCCW